MEALTSPGSINIPIPNGSNFSLDVSRTVQLDENFTIIDASANGSAPSGIESIMISQDGTLSAQYENGTVRSLFRIPLATARSPDMLKVMSGNVFSETNDSGSIQIGFPNEGGMGAVLSGALKNPMPTSRPS
jgi:flagellar hook protein FlgE